MLVLYGSQDDLTNYRDGWMGSYLMVINIHSDLVEVHKQVLEIKHPYIYTCQLSILQYLAINANPPCPEAGCQFRLCF